MKKIISILLIAAMLCCCFAGCKPADDTKIIGVCMQNKSSSIAVLQEEALKEMFEPQGYEVQVVSADDSSATQRSQVENFILMGVEMLVILPCEISTLEDSLIKAREQGIKVVVSGGTGTVSEDAYDAVCSDDEFMVGMYVASVAKTWIEEHMDPNGDWEVHFLSSTLSEDAITRCKGEAMILEPWLKNVKGEYVNLMGEVVDEANKVANPVYCEMVASRVSSYDACSTQMSMTDNKGVVSNVLTENPKVRIFIAYNSLASTAGSTHITDHYSKEEVKEFAFFSGGVMGNEYEYLIGSVSDDAGTYSCFRGAVQFGGGDAAATLADLCSRVMFGEAGKDYGKTNPNSIGLYYPIDGEMNNGVDALVCFDSPSQIAAYTYEEVLNHEGLMTYWDSVGGYNANMQEKPEEPDVPVVTDGAYTYEYEGMGGTETAQITLKEDGTARFEMVGHMFLVDIYEGTYTREGNVVNIKGLTNVDAASEYKIPGLWDWIDSTTGDAVITVDDANKLFVPGESVVVIPGVYTYTYEGMGGEETAKITLNDDGTVRFEMVDHMFLVDVYEGTYTREGNVVTIKGFTNVDAASEYKIPGLWPWIDSTTGDATITVDDATGTFTAGAAEQPDAPVVPEGNVIAAYTYTETNPMGLEIAWTLTLKDNGTYTLTEVNAFVGEVSYEGTSYTQTGNTITCGAMTSAPAVSDWAKAEGFVVSINGESFAPGAPAGEAKVYTYSETNGMGLEISWTLTLNADGSYVLTEVNAFVGEVSYQGSSYTVDGNTVTCGAMASAPAVSDWAKAEGFTATIDGETFTPVI